VLNSLADTLPHEDWRSLARYMISRALLHGRCRTEEMHSSLWRSTPPEPHPARLTLSSAVM
jgi:hypothetical protein